ncbi:MAG: IS3 family transposase [Yoonia sp.]|nr:IS3 family transposase [Yoonia sp.]
MQTGRNTRTTSFDYIEFFYNPKRKHARNGMLSPVNFENRQHNINQESVEETRGYSYRI